MIASDILSRSESLSILRKALAGAAGEECIARLSSSWSPLTRFAANRITQNVVRREHTLSMEVSLGLRTGSASTTDLEGDALRRVAQKAKESAQRSREDPEHMPPLGPQDYLITKSYASDSAWSDPEERVQAVAEIITRAKKKGLTASGILEVSRESSSMRTSKGLEGVERSSAGHFSITMQRGIGSGCSEQIAVSPKDLDIAAHVEKATQTALDSAHPREIQPGEYPVILSPHALAPLLWTMVWYMDARAADEKRSFFSKKVGSKIAADGVTLRSDPSDDRAPGSSFRWDGLPSRSVSWIEEGILRNLIYDRYWAQKKLVTQFTYPSNLMMDGDGDGTTEEELIGEADKAIYVSRLWYIRMVEPMSLTLTGITRDGTFWIEKGRKATPLRNLRFNDSPIRLLKGIDALGPCALVPGNPLSLIPTIRARSFRFTSVATL